MERLHPAERAHAVKLRRFRLVQYVGGRLAMQSALRQIGVAQSAVLSDARGAPVLPPGTTGSISHKRTIAVAMVCLSKGHTLGVDIEDYGPARLAIAPKVLRPEELDAIAHLPDPQRWMATLLRFSIKESIYKALDPWVRRFVDFHEAHVVPDLAGRANVTLHLARKEGPFTVDARYEWLRGRLLTSVRIRNT